MGKRLIGMLYTIFATFFVRVKLFQISFKKEKPNRRKWNTCPTSHLPPLSTYFHSSTHSHLALVPIFRYNSSPTTSVPLDLIGVLLSPSWPLGSIWCYESIPFWSISFSSLNQHISWSSSYLSDDSFSSFGRVLSFTQPLNISIPQCSI